MNMQAQQTWSEVEHRQHMATKYFPLVYKVLKKMSKKLPTYVEQDDLVGVGALGLIDAIGKYNPDKGKSFEAYATYRIRGAILDELRQRDEMPRVLRGKVKKLEKAIQSLTSRLGRPPEEDEIIDELHLNQKKYRKLLMQIETTTHIAYNDQVLQYYREGVPASHGAVQPRRPMFNDNSYPGEECIQFEQIRKLLFQEGLHRIAEAIATLDKRSQLIFSLHYRDGLNFREIGDIVGLTESRISQIHKACIQSIRVYVLCDA